MELECLREIQEGLWALESPKSAGPGASTSPPPSVLVHQLEEAATVPLEEVTTRLATACSGSGVVSSVPVVAVSSGAVAGAVSSVSSTDVVGAVTAFSTEAIAGTSADAVPGVAVPSRITSSVNTGATSTKTIVMLDSDADDDLIELGEKDMDLSSSYYHWYDTFEDKASEVIFAPRLVRVKDIHIFEIGGLVRLKETRIKARGTTRKDSRHPYIFVYAISCGKKDVECILRDPRVNLDSDDPNELRSCMFKMHVAKLVPASQGATPIEIPDTLSDDCLAWAALEQEVPPRPPPKTPPKYRQLRDDLSDMKKQQANLLTQKAKLEKKLRDKDLLLKDKESMLHHLFD